MLPSKRQECCSKDRFSQLPIAILTHILCFVPIKDAARTSVLSKQLRYIWTALPHLNLERACSLIRRTKAPGPRKWVIIVKRILEARTDTVVSCHLSSSFRGYEYAIEGHLLRLAKLGVQELVISNLVDPDFLLWVEPSKFKSLKVLIIAFCKVSILPAPKPWFTKLAWLRLCEVRMTDQDNISDLVESCQVLHRLELIYVEGFKDLTVKAPMLLDLRVASNRPLNIILEEAPRLICLRIWFAHFEADSRGFFALLKSLGGIKNLLLDFCEMVSRSLFSGRHLEGMYLPLNKLQKFTLNINFEDACQVSFLSCILRNSPNLEEITLMRNKHSGGAATSRDYWEKQKPFSCLTHHLKTIQIKEVNLDNEAEVLFLKFLLTNSSVLERMMINCFSPSGREEEIFAYLANLRQPALFSRSYRRAKTEFGSTGVF